MVTWAGAAHLMMRVHVPPPPQLELHCHNEGWRVLRRVCGRGGVALPLCGRMHAHESARAFYCPGDALVRFHRDVGQAIDPERETPLLRRKLAQPPQLQHLGVLLFRDPHTLALLALLASIFRNFR